MTTAAPDILAYILVRYLPMNQNLVIKDEHVPLMASGLLECLGQCGWRLEYHPELLTENIKKAIEELGPAPEGIPINPPEELEFNQ